MCVCVFARSYHLLLNHLGFVNCYHVCLGVHKPLIKWDNWCLSQAAGRLTHGLTGMADQRQEEERRKERRNEEEKERRKEKMKEGSKQGRKEEMKAARKERRNK